MAAFHTAPNPEPPQVNAGPSPDGKFLDADFPPTNDSIFRSPNPAADHVQDVVNHAGGPGRQVEWRRLSEICDHGRLFNHVHPNDIAQGVLGDCWLLAGMAGMAEFEGAVLHLFQDKKVNEQGMYTINIHNPVSDKWEAVVVDDFIPLGPDGQPLMSKPQGNEMWVLLLEKAFAKWFGSYVQIQGAYCLVGYMFMADCDGKCKCFSQNTSGQPPFNTEVFTVVGCHMTDAHNRGSVGLQPMGQIDQNTAWQELVKHDAANHIMCAWTSKDPPVAAGRGASGEVIAGDGIVKGHAYSFISAREVQADGRIWRVVQLRNPWGANPAAEWKGELSDNWPGWPQFPELGRALEIGTGALDGMFWMSWDDFRRRYSDIGVVPKQMEVPKMGVTEGASTSNTSKHGKKFKKPAPAAAPATYAAEPVAMHDPGAVTYMHYDPAPAVTYAAAPATYAASSVVMHDPGAVTYVHHDPAPAVTYAAAPATYAAAPTSSVVMHDPGAFAFHASAPAVTYAAAAAPVTYAAAPFTTYAAPGPFTTPYASAPMTTYASGPVTYAAVPSTSDPPATAEDPPAATAAAAVTYAAAPFTTYAAPGPFTTSYASAPMTTSYASGPVTYAAAPYSGAPTLIAAAAAVEPVAESFDSPTTREM